MPSGPFEVADRQHGRVVLGLLEERLGDAPDLAHPYARWHAATDQLLVIDEPVWLRVAADDGGRQERQAAVTAHAIEPRTTWGPL